MPSVSTSQFGGSLPAQVPVELRQIFPSASFVGCGNIRVSSATADSRQCRPGCLFVAIPGTQIDGHDCAADAVARGASALLVMRPIPEIRVPQCIVPDTRHAFAHLCSELWRTPSRNLKTIGITGTNGKTTTTYLCRAIFQAAGKRCGLLGTIEYYDGEQSSPSSLTTPDPTVLSSWLGRMVHRRTTHVAMEVSSHALDQQRLAGTWLDAAVITNITQDHFDYHHNLETYRRTKHRITERLKVGGVLVLNADDRESWPALSSDSTYRRLTFGLQNPADVSAEMIDESLAGSLFELKLPGRSIAVQTRLLGRHNVANCLAASAVAWNLGVDAEEIAQGLASLAAVPGRMEAIDCGQLFSVFVDYAHTDDALRRCISGLKRLTPGRVIVVYGAGGDRDRTKRPLLTRAAAEADVAILTSDNPRTESPLQIIEDCLTGCVTGRPQPYVEADRAGAIKLALEMARPGDSVLIAGKGHETVQIIGRDSIHFDDRQVARECLTNSLVRTTSPSVTPIPCEVLS